MRLLILKTKETVEMPDDYGMRLFEQGKAIPAPKKAEAKKAKAESEKLKTEKG